MNHPLHFYHGRRPRNNSMVFRHPTRRMIVIDKNEIYDDARVVLHKFGDARLTDDNYYHINTVQADDLPEDVKLFDKFFMKAFRNTIATCLAYYRASARKEGQGDIELIPDEVLFVARAVSEQTKQVLVDTDEDWTITLSETIGESEEPQEQYVYGIGLNMPHTWDPNIFPSIVEEANNYILWSIVSDFLKITEPREYGEYYKMADDAKHQLKILLDSRRPFTQYIEQTPF